MLDFSNPILGAGSILVSNHSSCFNFIFSSIFGVRFWIFFQNSCFAFSFSKSLESEFHLLLFFDIQGCLVVGFASSTSVVHIHLEEDEFSTYIHLCISGRRLISDVYALVHIELEPLKNISRFHSSIQFTVDYFELFLF